MSSAAIVWRFSVNAILQIIYTARNVRDAVWSLFSLHSWFRIGGGDLHFHEYFEKFMEGKGNLTTKVAADDTLSLSF